MSNTEKYLKLCKWLFNRYKVPGPDGYEVTTSRGGKPTRYARLEDAAWKKYIAA